MVIDNCDSWPVRAELLLASSGRDRLCGVCCAGGLSTAPVQQRVEACGAAPEVRSATPSPESLGSRIAPPCGSRHRNSRNRWTFRSPRDRRCATREVGRGA